MFSYRNSTSSILYTGNPMNMKSSVVTGDSITLKITNTDIYVKNVKILEDGKYSGTIHGFEPPYLTEFDNFKLGDCVKFNDGQIFSCSKY